MKCLLKNAGFTELQSAESQRKNPVTLAIWNALILSAFYIFVAGCSSQPTAVPEPAAEPDEQVSASTDDHHHGAGPHGGTLADWGGGAYHIEFTVDHDKQESVVYVLGDDAKTPAPIKTDKLLLNIIDPAFQVELTALPLEGEAAGTSSRFVGQHATLGEVQEFAGTVIGEVEGTPYAGDFKEAAHEPGRGD